MAGLVGGDHNAPRLGLLHYAARRRKYESQPLPPGAATHCAKLQQPACAGEGVPLNHAVSHRLLQELTGLGDGDSQTDLGFTLALGIEPLGAYLGAGRRRLGWLGLEGNQHGTWTLVGAGAGSRT